MKVLYLIIQGELTYYSVKSTVSLEQGGRRAQSAPPAALTMGAQAVPGKRYPGVLPHCPPTPYQEPKATNFSKSANLRVVWRLPACSEDH